MDKKTVGRVVGLVVATLLLGASIFAMYSGLGRFDALWFWSTIIGFVVLMVLDLILFRGRGLDEDPAAQYDASPSSAAGVASRLSAAALPDLPLQVSKATGMLPVEAASVVEAPRAVAGFTFRGFTLYEKMAFGKPSRFFSKDPPAMGEPVPLPAGYEAVWDAKKAQPVLVRRSDEEPQVEVVGAATKPCSAWTSPGEICERQAVPGTLYCKQHAKYKPGMEWGSVEARVGRGKAGASRLRSITPEIEVITPRGGQAKPLRVRIPTVDVRLDRAGSKPFRPGKAPEPVVRMPRGEGLAKPLRLKEPRVEVRLARGDAGRVKPLRLGAPDLEVRTARPKPLRPLSLKEPKVEVRRFVETRKPAKPLRVNLGDVMVVKPTSNLDKALKLGFNAEIAGVSTPKGDLGADPRKTQRCLATLKNGKRCGNDAQPRRGYCKQHASFKPTTEVLVAKDSKARSGVGLPDAALTGQGKTRKKA